MNRIDEKFKALAEAGKKAFIAFITSGDPSLEDTARFARVLEENGVDILELGVPFSDPVAEGPTIAAASERALRGGVKTDDIFKMAEALRQTTDMPILFMLYINSIYAYGKEKFFENCAAAGVDGVIVPDLPFEEKDEIEGDAEKHGLYSIRLIAPTSRERAGKIAEGARGFIYAVSVAGVTGVRREFNTDFAGFSAGIKEKAAVPAAVGFGIKDAATAKELAAYFDGVIIGSAFVDLIGRHGADAGGGIAELARSVRRALDRQ
ncbi:MAG: tryptophan synthase subunit alpha [Clostridiales bacterium]|jgi:tryptophan synthase alpha chain|nr:tryptophan synthase subunit alpha [Clostridiales bacterium]